LINAHQIAKAFADRPLFQDLSFSVEVGERVGLVGPNGSGKSTLLRLLGGLLDADRGTVSRKRGLRLGFMEQTQTFPAGATVLTAVLQKAGDSSEALGKVMEVMAQLNLHQLGDETPVETLSGGWQKRVALARELVLEPELLILDEPTNHLDLSGILWLEDYLARASFAVLMVTHDRLFLQRVCNRILDLDPRNPHDLLSVKGDYLQYLEVKERELAALRRQERVQRNRLRREKEWLSRGAIARQTKQRARIEGAEDLAASVTELQAKNQSRRLELSLGAAEHAPQRLIEATAISKAYDEKRLFSDLDVLITPKTRLALLGDNGSGKSTLIRILLGQEPADRGTIKQAESLKVAYFEQFRETLRPELSVLQNICPEGDYVHVQGQAMHVRSYLDRFSFGGLKAELPVSRLSGGEQARLRLAQLMMQSAQVLILDEPTNDLDRETLDLLEEAIDSFQGAVLLVTHDRDFMDSVANQILAFPVEGVGDSHLRKFSSYFQWERWHAEEKALSAKNIAAKLTGGPAPKAAAAARSRLSYKEKYELENMEATILGLESEIEDLNRRSQDPEVLSDHKKLTEILARLAHLQSELDTRYQRWSELDARK
jgi:ATP-binding cassette subfamily F protein uup